MLIHTTVLIRTAVEHHDICTAFDAFPFSEWIL